METTLRIYDSSSGDGQVAAPGSSHLVGWDAVRALAAVGVVLLHACVPYLQHPMPGLAWSVIDTPSGWVDPVFWSIEIFIMPLFLVMAGFFAARSLAQSDSRSLITSRAKRLLRPLLWGMLVLLPIDLYIWVLGWVAEGFVPIVKLRSLKFDSGVDQNLWGLSHLWFLLYLFSYVCSLAVVTKARGRQTSRAGAIINRFDRSPLSVAMIAVLMLGTITLTICPEVIWGFQHDFFPVPSKWIYNGLFFALGVVLGTYDPQARQLASLSPRWIGVAVCVLLMAVTLGTWAIELGEDRQTQLAGSLSFLPVPGNGWQVLSRITLAAMTTAASLLVSLSILSLALRSVVRVPPSVKYLAAASFWIYLVHHPLVGLVHLDLKWITPAMPVAVKVMVTLAISLAISLASFEVLVRRTRFGKWMGMAAASTPKPTAIDSIRPHYSSEPTRRAA